MARIMTGGPSQGIRPPGGSDGSATCDEVDEKHDEGYDQQRMDDVPAYMHREAKEPEQQQYADDRVQHEFSLLSDFDGPVVSKPRSIMVSECSFPSSQHSHAFPISEYLMVGSLTRCESHLYFVVPLFQIARTQLCVITLSTQLESNIEQPPKGARSMMEVTDSVKRLQEAGLCSSPNESSLNKRMV